MFHNYSIDDFIQAVNSETSIRKVLLRLGLKDAGGNYATVKNKIKSLGLDTSHFRSGNGWSKGLKLGVSNRARPLEAILIKNSTFQSHKLRLRLLKEGLLKAICKECGITEWQNKPLTLELEHINGDNSDNRLENLTLLCPNCHSQTSTFRRRKK